MALPDSFTGTSNTELSSYDSTWVEHTSYSTGRLDIRSNQCGIQVSPSTNANTSCYYYNSSPSSADYKVEAKAKWTSTAGNVGGIAGRVSSSANTMYFARINDANVEIYKLVAGTATSLGSASHGISTNTTCTLALDMSGTTIRALIDGTQKVSQTDSAISATGYGGFRINGSNDAILFDDFDAVVASSGTTLSAAAGSYSITGTAITADVKVTADAGSYTISGASASTLINAACVAGSYTLTGAPATLTATGQDSPTMAVDAGGYTLQGQPASFALAHLVDAGGYAITGADAQLNSALQCAPGSYGITGHGVDFTTTGPVTLSADAGIYTLTGLAAVLTATGMAYWPLPSEVKAGVQYGPSGTDYTGTYVGAVPSAADVAAAVLAAAQIVPIHANVHFMNDAEVIGTGTTGDSWRGVNVSP